MTIQNSLFRTATTGYSHWQFPNPRWFECWLSHSLCSDCSIKPRPRGKRWWHGLGWRGDGLFWLQRGGRGWGWAGAAVPAQQWKVYPSHRGAQGSVGGRPTEAPNPCSQSRGLRAALGRCSLSQQAPGCLQNELDYSAQARQRARLQGSPLPTSSASAPVSFPCCFNLGLSPLPVTSCHYLGAHQLLPWEPHPPRFSGLSWVLKVWIFTFPSLCQDVSLWSVAIFHFFYFPLIPTPFSSPQGLKQLDFHQG